MNRLSDGTVDRLRRLLEWPEVPGERYVAVEAIGQGGMGTVYLARDRVLDRDVALKVLRPETESHALTERLRREARILADLEHPGIVPVHDAGILADGRVFYVMKLVRGERLDQFASTAGPSEVLRVFLRVCETVGFAHTRGIIHRDLKPANIMVGAFGEILVLDWGIARIRDELTPEPATARDATTEDDRRGKTLPGTVLGTPGFMAPEQARGEVDLVDPRTDVYALGAILRAIAGGDAAPRRLVSIWRKATQPDPAARYSSPADLAADVTRFLDALPVSAHRERPLERAARLYQKYPTPIILVLAYLAMRLAFLVARKL